jgi:hypothetical protein
MSEYLVLEKSDGLRYLLIETTCPEEMFLVDRKYTFRKVFPRFALPIKSNSTKRQIFNIFDGELILDRHSKIPTYLIFDAILIQKALCMLSKFKDRLFKSAEEVRNRYRKAQIMSEISQEVY